MVNMVGPRACYDEGKRCTETLFYDYRRQHRLDVRSRAYSTPTARICILRTAASSPTSSCKP